jgi:hypothetical protein
MKYMLICTVSEGGTCNRVHCEMTFFTVYASAVTET